MKRPPESPVARLLAKSHILDDALAAALSNKLPDTLKGYNLKLLYSLQQHGADPGTFYARCQFDHRTLTPSKRREARVLGLHDHALAAVGRVLRDWAVILVAKKQ